MLRDISIFSLSLSTCTVISAKLFGAANMNVSLLENEVFPVEEDLVNFTQHVIPAQISISPQVLLEAVSKSGSDGEL